MKSLYTKSSSYSTGMTMNRQKKLMAEIGIIFLLLLFALTANAQITRTQIMNNANSYASYSWTAGTSNIWNNVNCSSVGKYIQTPSWVTTGSKVAVPYCWGGWSTLSAFATGISNGRSGGDNNTSTSYGDQYGNCAVGVDCSGGVTRWWGITSQKYNTSMLDGISYVISASQVQQGDILNKSGTHVRLVQSYNSSNGYTTVIESSNRDWRVSSYSYSPALNSGYTPRVYNIFQQCNTPTGIYVSNITSNTAMVYCNAVSNATQYSIGIRPSSSSSYTYYTVSGVPIYLTNLLSSTTYYFKLAAYCASSGWTSYSGVYSFTTSSSGGSCPIPYGAYAYGITANSAVLNWTSTYAISYNFYIKPASASSWWYFGNSTYKPVQFTGLSSGTTYYFKLSENCNGGQTSGISSTIAFTTASAFIPGDTSATITISDGAATTNTEKYDAWKNITLVPNPVLPGHDLEVYGLTANCNITVMFTDGKVISNFKKNNGESFTYHIPEELTGGIYVIRIVTEDGGQVYKKLVVE